MCVYVRLILNIERSQIYPLDIGLLGRPLQKEAYVRRKDARQILCTCDDSTIYLIEASL